MRNPYCFIRLDERPLLHKYASASKVGILEIGVFNGNSSAEMAAHTETHIWGIDPIVPDSMNHAALGSEDAIRRNTAHFPNFTFIKDYSYNVVKAWKAPIDLLFIDGDHCEDAVRKDFTDWFPHLVKGGICMLHDAGALMGGPPQWPGPSKLALDLKTNWTGVKYLERVDSLVVFQRSG